MSFEQFNLDQRVLDGVNAAGYTTPTPIQEQAIPVVLEGRDVLGLAQTGTGKTAAFMLPILHQITQQNARRGVRALIIAPTRELAEQIREACNDLGKYTGVRSTSIYGGVSKVPQVTTLRRGVDIVVACPGRLLDHLNDRNIDLSNVDILVIDEADTMFDMGFLPDIRRILGHLPKQRQTLFFAATMPDEIRTLANDILSDPATIQIGVIAPAKTVSHTLYPVTEKLKKSLLLSMLQQTPTGRVLIFTRTKHRARRLALDLEQQKFRVTALQGNMPQNKRLRSINGFRDGQFDFLVATDIASRGIDVSEISHVINFDMPNTVDAYIHRIGRTGRAHHTGEAITFLIREDEAMVRRIEELLGARIERRRLPGFDYGGFDAETQPRRANAPQTQQTQQPSRRGGNTSRGTTTQSRPPGNTDNSVGNRRPQSAKPPARRRFHGNRSASSSGRSNS
ncbi:MAG: DEAD/DEAH box helicase [Chloroflexi bacterium]|nr:DEAD/DEAH box helicase [Chloroflexota bacterium]